MDEEVEDWVPPVAVLLLPFPPLPGPLAETGHSVSPAQWPMAPQAEQLLVRFLSCMDLRPVNLRPNVAAFNLLEVTVSTDANSLSEAPKSSSSSWSGSGSTGGEALGLGFLGLKELFVLSGHVGRSELVFVFSFMHGFVLGLEDLARWIPSFAFAAVVG